MHLRFASQALAASSDNVHVTVAVAGANGTVAVGATRDGADLGSDPACSIGPGADGNTDRVVAVSVRVAVADVALWWPAGYVRTLLVVMRIDCMCAFACALLLCFSVSSSLAIFLSLIACVCVCVRAFVFCGLVAEFAEMRINNDPRACVYKWCAWFCETAHDIVHTRHTFVCVWVSIDVDHKSRALSILENTILC